MPSARCARFAVAAAAAVAVAAVGASASAETGALRGRRLSSEDGVLVGAFSRTTKFEVGNDPKAEWDVATYTDEHLTHSCAKYVDDGSTVFSRDGNLVLKVSSACPGGGCLNSGRVMSKQAFKYGLFTFTARVPKCNDIWPALWLLPVDKDGNGRYGGWPCSGEIDVLETVGDHEFATYNLVAGHGTDGWDGEMTCNRCRPEYKVSSSLANSSAGGYFVENAPDCSALGPGEASWDEHTFVFSWQPDHMTTWVDPVLEYDGKGRVVKVTPKEQSATGQGEFPTWKTYDRSTTPSWKAVEQFMQECYAKENPALNAPFDIPYKIVLNVAVGGYDGAACKWGSQCDTGCGKAIGSELVVSDISVWQEV